MPLVKEKYKKTERRIIERGLQCLSVKTTKSRKFLKHFIFLTFSILGIVLIDACSNKANMPSNNKSNLPPEITNFKSLNDELETCLNKLNKSNQNSNGEGSYIDAFTIALNNQTAFLREITPKATALSGFPEFLQEVKRAEELNGRSVEMNKRIVAETAMAKQTNKYNSSDANSDLAAVITECGLSEVAMKDLGMKMLVQTYLSQVKMFDNQGIPRTNPQRLELEAKSIDAILNYKNARGY